MILQDKHSSQILGSHYKERRMAGLLNIFFISLELGLIIFITVALINNLRTEHWEIIIHTYEYLSFDKNSQNDMYVCWKNWITMYRIMKIVLYLSAHIELNSKSIKDLKNKYLQLIELTYTKNFWIRTSIIQAVRTMINK